ncbi:6257_t:CDS:2 [Racocetra fulgida]|uniref:6257_t:CDS:1 n=1 Tax=Racocetra fulgida TaxID=60492 RepID=A0A9N8VSI1_9GLOM|nr:6257_t:CDS:2 [Racocetra fulgida]
MEEGDETVPIVTNSHDPFNAVSINKLRAPTDYQLIDEIDQFMGIWFGNRTLRASLNRLDQQAFGNMRPANNEINETTRNAETLLDSWLPDNFKAWVDFIYPVALTTVVSTNGTNEDALDRELAFPSYVLSTHHGQFCVMIPRREMYNDQFPDLACHLHHLNEGINHQECRRNLTHHDYEQQCAGQRIFSFTEQEQQLILNPENGVIMCGDCGSLETWGESGPHNAPGIRQQCKNQHQIQTVTQLNEIKIEEYLLPRSGMRLGADHLPHFIFTI